VRVTALQTPRSVKKEGGGGARDAGAESLPLQLVMKTMVRRAVPLQPMEVHSGAEIHLQPVESGGCLKEAVTPWGAHSGAGSCQDLRTHGERSSRQSRFAGWACDPLGDPHWSSLFLKDCTPWEGPTLGQFVKSCSPWEGLTLEKFMENYLL